MKSQSTLKFTFAATALMAMSAWAQYEPIDPPPSFVDYQGRVLDALGDPVAQGTTENIEMYFRIWNDIADDQPPKLVWAEKQIVTVADGNFSIRLGEGDPIESSAGDNVIDPGNDDPRPPLLGVFETDDDTMRYLGVSVAPNSSTKPQAEIQPRLAFLTTPYAAVAEKARFAEFGPSGGPFEASRIGIGTNDPGSLLEVTGINELAADNGAGLISAGLLTSNHIAMDADDIQSYVDQGNPGTLKLNSLGGNIQIGSVGNQTDVSGLFSVFAGGFGGQFKVVDEGASNDAQVIASLDAAFGVSGSQLRFEGDAPSVEIGQDQDGDFVVETGTNTQRLVVTQNGNVGIGHTAPADRLTVSGGNIHLSNGDLEVRARGQFVIIGEEQNNTGMTWADGFGNTLGRVYYRGRFNRLYAVNSSSSLYDGVYLDVGGNAWLNGSDERLKSDIEPVTGILDKIEDIRVVSYNMGVVTIDEKSGKSVISHDRPPRKTQSGQTIKHEIGTIAQDWVEHFPQLVSEPQDEDDHYGLAYGRIGVVALGAAKELNAKLKEQEAQIKERDEKIADLEVRLARLEGLMKAAK